MWSGRWAAEKERRGDIEDVDVELRVEDGGIELRGERGNGVFVDVQGTEVNGTEESDGRIALGGQAGERWEMIWG